MKFATIICVNIVCKTSGSKTLQYVMVYQFHFSDNFDALLETPVLGYSVVWNLMFKTHISSFLVVELPCITYNFARGASNIQYIK